MHCVVLCILANVCHVTIIMESYRKSNRLPWKSSVLYLSNPTPSTWTLAKSKTDLLASPGCYCYFSVTKLCPTVCDPMDCGPPGSSVHGILQARILEWAAVPFSRGIFLTQGSNLGLLHCWQILNHLSHQESPSISTLLPFLERHSSFFWRTLNISCNILLVINSPNVCLRKFLFLFHSFTRYQILVWQFFFSFSTYFTPLFSCLHISCSDFQYNCYSYSSIGKVFSFSDFLF